MVAPKSPLIGVVGDPFDPVAQLAPQLNGSDAGELVEVGQYLVLPKRIEQIFITSQQRFIACSRMAFAFNGATTVVLRRQRAEDSTAAWLTGLSLLRELLDRHPGADIVLVALTQDAATDIGEIIGRDIAVMAQPDHGTSNREAATLDSKTMIITRQSDAATLPADAMNWNRKRMLLNVTVADDAAPDLRDLVTYANSANSVIPLARAATRKPVVMFIVPNGVGLGHITRIIAIARELQKANTAEPLIWCYSRAADLARRAAIPVILRQTAGHLDADPEAWRAWEAADLARTIRRTGCAAIVYDGSTIDRSLITALAAPGTGNCRFIWLRRAMWQAGSRADVLDAVQHVDLVLEPGEFAAAEDRGPTTTYVPVHSGIGDHRVTAPVVLVSKSDMLPRAEARRALGLAKRGPLCLVSLGADSVVDKTLLTAQISRAGQDHGLGVIWAQSPLATPVTLFSQGFQTIDSYPLGQYLNAFDGVISAAGYNSFHELMGLSDAPVLFAPNIHPNLDDQLARARFAQAQGWCQLLPDETEAGQTEVLTTFFQSVRKGQKVPRPVQNTDGAQQIADHIDQLVHGRELQT